MTIRRKLIAIQLFTALVVLVIASGILLTREIRSARESLVSSLSSTAAVVGENSASTLIFFDRNSAEQVLLSLRAESQISSASIYDGEGRLFATYVRDAESPGAFPEAEPQSHRFRDGFLELFQPITRAGQLIGTVFIRADLDALSERIDGYLRDAVGVVLFGLILSIGLSYVTQRTISRPILDLVTTTRNVSETGDYTQRVQARGGDELGTLSEAYNQMLGLIQKRDASLLEARATLENRVEERTEELEEAKTRLEQALDSEHDARTTAEEARRIAETANRTKSVFLANMSHEIRTPLNAILGYAQILDGDDALSDPHQRAIRTIRESGEHLLSLINNVLDISKIEAGREKMNIQDFELDEVLRGLSKMFERRCDEKDLAWRLDRNVSPGAVRGDQNKLRQVLINLLGNAVKFTHEGEIVLRVTQEEDRYTFEVSDTGPGIAAEKQKSIFESFQQDTEGLHQGGTGLGLAISKRHVEMMGGALNVTSAPGQGAAFRFSLTLPPGAITSQSPGDADYTHIDRVKGSLRVLVVDDVETNRDILEHFLLRVGAEVESVDSGPAALEAVRRNRPDAILLDIRMPGMDGAETQRQLVAEHGDGLIIIAVTASVFEHQRQAYRDAGFSAFIDKPLRAEQVYQALEEFVGVTFERSAPEHAPESEALGAVDLPAEVLSRFRQAVESHSITDLRTLAAEIGELGSEEQILAGRVEGLANQYDFEAIGVILEGITDRKQA